MGGLNRTHRLLYVNESLFLDSREEKGKRYVNQGNVHQKVLRANVCNFRKSVDSREFLNSFIFCLNNLYSTLISKITLKLVTAFYFFRNFA